MILQLHPSGDALTETSEQWQGLQSRVYRLLRMGGVELDAHATPANLEDTEALLVEQYRASLAESAGVQFTLWLASRFVENWYEVQGTVDGIDIDPVCWRRALAARVREISSLMTPLDDGGVQAAAEPFSAGGS